MGPPVVVPLDPGLGGIVECLESQLVLVLEHGEQAVLDVEPEVLLLGVLIGRIGQRGDVDDAEAFETLNGLVGQHRPAVVGHQRPRKSALLDGLREPMGEALGRFAAVPLDVTGQARVVVEHAQHLGPDPASLSDQDLARGLVVVEVPEAVDVLGLVAAHLASFQTFPGEKLPGGRMARKPFPARQPLALHVTQERGVGRERSDGRLAEHELLEVVVVQLHAPRGVVVVLALHGLPQKRRETGLCADVLTNAVTQSADGIARCRKGAVVPPLDRRDGKVNRLARDRVTPALPSEILEGASQLAALARR